MNNIQYRKFEDIHQDSWSENIILSSRDIEVRWVDINFDRGEKVKIHEKNNFMELHFQFNGISRTFFDNREIILSPNSQTIFHVMDFSGEHRLYKDNLNPFSFLEIKMRQDAVKRLFPKGMWNELGSIQDILLGKVACISPIRPISPQMFSVIFDMCHNPFMGVLKKAYLEAKIVELFLLQTKSHCPIQNIDLKREEQDKIIAAREYLDRNYQRKIRIVDLAMIVGTNQQTLKKGFKEMFHTTIFSYYNGLRMEKAKYLLMDSGKSISEVSDEIGYTNPQHFTVAFKKKFGLLPKNFK